MFFVLFILASPLAAAQTCSLNADGRAENVEVEVLIFGAGIAGISAARSLEVNGVTDFLVLEASDRVGGRIREYDGTNIEVGANWIHGLDPEDPNHHPIWREWTRCDPDGPGGSVTPDFTAVYSEDGTQIDIEDENAPYLTGLDEFESAYDAALEKVASGDISIKQGLKMEGWEASSTLENFIEWSRVDLELGIAAENLSLLFLSKATAYTDFTEKDEEGEDYLVVDDRGYSFVVKCLAKNFIDSKVRLNSTVESIKLADDCVCAQVKDGAMYCAQYGIVTFSTGVLQAAIRGDQNSVEFEPPLPLWKQDAINSISPVYYGKIFLVFQTRFWNETNEDQQALGYVANQKGHYGYYLIHKNRPNTITVDVTEDLALRVAAQTQEETVNELMEILSKIFDRDDLPQPETVIISKWNLDPLFLHSYSDYGPGVPESVFEDLLKPVNGRLYFAGEALNRTNYGYTQGAYGTGAYAAGKISVTTNDAGL